MSAKRLKHTFEGYLNDIYYNPNLVDESEVMEKMQYFRQFAGIYHHGFFPLFFIIDYTKQQYLLHAGVDCLIPGYYPQDFLEGGMDMLRHVVNKDDFRIYSLDIFVRNCQLLESAPREEHSTYVFSSTFRVETPSHKQEFILQRGAYITSPVTALPLYSLGICLNITNLKSDTRILHSIEKKSISHPGGFQNIVTNYFYPHEEDTLFTNKEKEVLLYMTDGLSAKQIAGKMHIAEATVIIHRKNMMRKSNAKNAVELVAYAIKNAII
ncbi:LuxR family transcriptional regulator [Compostibacter hankyongensis]|uniref:HTH luxR-type domain-containing protein n=1 Tax=Compostibacter hankyongensis TaxID=1007089 RepID=A0ABP8G6A6_9BACT